MRNLMSFDALLVALHDSLAAASEVTRVRGEPDWMYRLRRQHAARVAVTGDTGVVDTHLALADGIHAVAPQLAEICVSFDCELSELPQGLCVLIARRRRWQRRPLPRMEILLHAGEPIETTVLIDGQVLRTHRGRPGS